MTRRKQLPKDLTGSRQRGGTNVTFSYLLDTWLSEHQVEDSTRASYHC